MWPERQLKEGFVSTSLTTKDGRVVSGFVQSEDQLRLVIRDPASEKLQVIARRDIKSRQDAGTIMPPGLTANLTRDELRDLARFLSERKGQTEPPSQPPASSR
ncbi:MAG: hypothetical protein GWO24_21035 [Akkermansiaceae bacterium]|nr:hypothetical protein [Akkermansiaceae bacterium]